MVGEERGDYGVDSVCAVRGRGVVYFGFLGGIIKAVLFLV